MGLELVRKLQVRREERKLRFLKRKQALQKAFAVTITQEDFESGIFSRIMESAASAVGLTYENFNFQDLEVTDCRGKRLQTMDELTDEIFPLTMRHRPGEASLYESSGSAGSSDDDLGAASPESKEKTARRQREGACDASPYLSPGAVGPSAVALGGTSMPVGGAPSPSSAGEGADGSGSPSGVRPDRPTAMPRQQWAS